MSWTDVASNIEWWTPSSAWGQGYSPASRALTSTEQAQVLDGLQSMYNGSPTARALLERSLSEPLRIAGTSGGGDEAVLTDPNGKYIHFDPAFAASFFNSFGTAVSSRYELDLIHELSHLVDGTADLGSPPPTDSQKNAADFNLMGPTVEVQNSVASEMGWTDKIQLAYHAAWAAPDARIPYISTASYTNGEEVDKVRLGDDNLGAVNNNLNHAANTTLLRDLMLGLGGTDTLNGGGGRDFLYGGAGNDSIIGGDGNDSIMGEGDNDTATGGSGNDALYGGSGNDQLSGDAGNDTLIAGLGTDTLDGGADHDVLSFAAATSGVSFTVGATSIAGNSVQNFEEYAGSNFADVIIGGSAGDTLSGLDGEDDLTGNGGADSLAGGGGDDEINGGGAADTLDGEANADILSGESGADKLFGGTGNDSLVGGADGDTLSGDTGDDTLDGGAGADSLFGGDGNDKLLGNGTDTGGEDTLDGGLGADYIIGADGRTLVGGADADKLVLNGNFGEATLAGGAGNDLLDLQGVDFDVSGPVTIQFSAGSGHDYIQMDGRGGNFTILASGYSAGSIELLLSSSPTLVWKTGSLDPNDESPMRWGYEHDAYLKLGSDTLYIGKAYWEDRNGWDGQLESSALRSISSNVTIDFGGSSVDLRDWISEHRDDIEQGTISSGFHPGLTAYYAAIGNGSAGDDTVSGPGPYDFIRGLEGNDLLIGTSGGDRIYGGDGDDQIAGGDGGDTLFGDAGEDQAIFNGDSGDYNFVRQFDGTVAVVDSNDVQVAYLVDIEAAYFNGDSQWGSMNELAGAYGTVDDDALLAGGTRGDRLFGLDRDDQLIGLGGNDSIIGGEGFDQANYLGDSTDYVALRSEDGTVTITDTLGDEGEDLLIEVEAVYFGGDSQWTTIDDLAGQYGTAGNDDWVGGTLRADALYGLTGDDQLAGLEGNDSLYGGQGADQVYYAGSSTNFSFLRNADGTVTVTDLVGSEGVDKLFDIEAIYFDGNDNWTSMIDLVGDYGTTGNDELIGGSANPDHLYGLAGDDVLVGGGGNDSVYGGDGDDLAAYAGSFSNFSFAQNLDGSITVTDLVGDEGVDRLYDVEAVYFDGSSTWSSVDDLFA